MVAGQGREATTASDEPDYLETKVDNTTVKVEGTELVVKSIDGLTVGAADISTWLAGTTNNVQTQIDEINDSLVAMTSGMHYRGRLETYADLQAITNKDNGDLAVVLADESRCVVGYLQFACQGPDTIPFARHVAASERGADCHFHSPDVWPCPSF